MDHADAAKSIKQMSQFALELLAAQKFAEAVVMIQSIAARAGDLLTPDEPGKK